jgi:hypothetical protein
MTRLLHLRRDRLYGRRPQPSTAKKYIDGIGDEDAMVNAKPHGICRGC